MSNATILLDLMEEPKELYLNFTHNYSFLEEVLPITYDLCHTNIIYIYIYILNVVG